MPEHIPTLLFVDQYGQIGGGQRILLDLVEAANTRGWQVHVLCPVGPLEEAVRHAGGEPHPLTLPSMRDGPKSVFAFLRGWQASRRIAKEYASLAQGCDLIVVNGPRTLAIARAWVRTLKKPTLLYLHKRYGRAEMMLVRFFLSLPRTAAVAVSALVVQPLRDLSNVHLIHNWVSVAFLEEPVSADQLRQTLGITDTHPIILVPGRFSPLKGQLLVLEASKLLSDIPCHFVFSGAPLFEGQGRKVAKELTAQAAQQPDRIHVIDWQEGMPALYDGADIVVVPSVWEEPFGLTAVEAMARSRPLIVTDRGTLPEIADGGRMAQVVLANAEAIAAALHTFFVDRQMWKERAERARTYVEEQFHPQKLQQQVFDVCASLLSS
ncbi:MAG: glycosyltransferase family 4 protein [Candidatus Peregrinibacteria bacterium]